MHRVRVTNHGLLLALMLVTASCESGAKSSPRADTLVTAAQSAGAMREEPIEASHDDYRLTVDPALLDSAARAYGLRDPVVLLARNVFTSSKTAARVDIDSTSIALLRSAAVGRDSITLRRSLANAALFQATMAGIPQLHDYQGRRQRCGPNDECSGTKHDFAAQVFALAQDGAALEDSTMFASEQIVAYVMFAMKGGTRFVRELDAESNNSDRTNPVNLWYEGPPGDHKWYAQLTRSIGGAKRPTKLPVTRVDLREPAPVVAAWHWDADEGVMLLGVRCGRLGWCIVGRDPNDASYRPTKSPQRQCDASTERCRVWGWSDTQTLAVYDRAMKALQLSTVDGTIEPTYDLDQITHDSEFEQYRQAATVFVTGDYVKQKRDGSPVTLFRGPGIENRILIRVPKTHKDSAYLKIEYWKGTQNLGYSTEYPGIRREHDKAHTPPGAARWEWSANDEGIWVRCAVGCCEVHFQL